LGFPHGRIDQRFASTKTRLAAPNKTDTLGTADTTGRLLMARKEKFEADGESELNNPFADLQIDSLPLGDQCIPARRPMGRVVLRRETAHRGGKTVIVIHDFASCISTRSIEELAAKLRRLCGCGGTTRQRMIEIQGNHAEKIRAILEKEGFRVAGVK
jgi:translation initiation factor 1